MKLQAYQVGDNDIVAHYSPEEALAFLCDFYGYHDDEYTVADVQPVSDGFLDAPMQNEDGTPSQSLRTGLAAAIEPTLLHRWD